MTTKIKISILLIIGTFISLGQTTVDTKTINIKNPKYKKVIKSVDSYFTLFFDALDYISSLDSNSNIKKQLNNYFAIHDTLVLNNQIEKQLNIWLIKEFDSYKSSALALGNVSVYNNNKKLFEKQFLNLNTTIIDRKENHSVKNLNVYTKTQVSYELLSADKKHTFYSTSMVTESDSSK